MGSGPAGDRAEYTFFNIDTGLRLGRHIRVARDSRARRQGLLGVDELGDGSGLWIVPCEAIHTFGMAMPIDVLFLDREFKVKKVRPHMPPRRIAVCLRAFSVVEMRPGAISASNTKVGDRLTVQRTAKENGLRAEPAELDATCRLF